jgi:hypothetical protein
MNGAVPDVTLTDAFPLLLALHEMGIELTIAETTEEVRLIVAAELDPQALSAVTEIFPPLASGVTSIEFDVDVPAHPEGSVHVYEVAPATAATENVVNEPLQTTNAPLIAEGCAGATQVSSVSACDPE